MLSIICVYYDFQIRIRTNMHETNGKELRLTKWINLKYFNELTIRSSYPLSNVIRLINSRRIKWVGKVASMGRWEIETKFCLKRLNGRDHSEDLDIDGRSKLTWVLGKEVWTAWIRFSWFRIGTGGVIFCARKWTFRFRIMRWIYWPAERIIWLVKKVPAPYN